jgi:hypothetical protein
MNARGLLAVIASLGMAACSTKRIPLGAYPYEVAAYFPERFTNTDALKVFPSEGTAGEIALPFRLSRMIFAADGKAIYGTNASGSNGIYREPPGLSKIEFKPTRLSPVPGTIPFFIRSFAVSARQDKVVISGNRTDTRGTECGVFEIFLPAGSVRQVLKSDCRYQWAWNMLGLSPDGAQAIATVGSNTDHDLHLELLDLVHGTAKSLGNEFWTGVWSPDGKWIAMLGNGNDKLTLVNAHDFSKRRKLGDANRIEPAWSPDSRYLLLWKYYWFKCGFYIDIEPPAALETIDIKSGDRITIRSSDCQLQQATAGWISREVAN